MPIELTMLALSAVLCVVMVLPYTNGITLRFGLATAAGNREDVPPLPGWIGRSRRAHANMVENLIPFAALVLAAQAAGKFGALTALGAQLFFYARLVYVPVYIAGIVYLRTLLWVVSVVGMALIAVAIFQ
jgi:uncharacterized MAPEG superfamily protein